MFRHLLCPTDMGERAYAALEKAIQISHQFDARITMLNVHGEFMDKKEREMLRVCVDTMKEKFEKTAIECKAEMKKIFKSLHSEEIKVDYLLRGGKVESEIVKTAEEIEADLIVISTDGRDNIKDFVAGTITEHVINTSPCPVLVIPFRK